MKLRNHTLLALAAIAGLAVSATAATISTSASAPTIDGADIANLATPTGAQNIWSDRNVQGQTFTTDSGGGTLTAITVQLWEDVADAPIQGWKDYTFRFGTVDISGDPNTIAATIDEIVRHDPDELPDTYFTFTLDTPLVLAPNTLYGFDIGMSASQEGWQDGISNVRVGGTYADGQRYSGDKPSDGLGPDINLEGDDMVFHLDITAVPEPGSLALLGLCGLGLTLRRRRS